MKIRIKDNSLRLRLSQSEVNHFEAGRIVSSCISFPNDATLRYTLVWEKGDTYHARFDGNEITVSVPYAAGAKWLDPLEVGMEHLIDLSGGEKLKLLIEKDFSCLIERKDEDESDLFPNPDAHC